MKLAIKYLATIAIVIMLSNSLSKKAKKTPVFVGLPEISEEKMIGTETIIKKCFKVPVPEKEAGEMCVKSTVSPQNKPNLSIFWQKLGENLNQNNPNKKFLRSFITELNAGDFSASVMVDGKNMSCKTVIENNLMSQDDLDKQIKELTDLVSPYLGEKTTVDITPKRDKVITAFLGVHRETTIGNELVPKMNLARRR